MTNGRPAAPPSKPIRLCAGGRVIGSGREDSITQCHPDKGKSWWRGGAGQVHLSPSGAGLASCLSTVTLAAWFGPPHSGAVAPLTGGGRGGGLLWVSPCSRGRGGVCSDLHKSRAAPATATERPPLPEGASWSTAGAGLRVPSAHPRPGTLEHSLGSGAAQRVGQASSPVFVGEGGGAAGRVHLRWGPAGGVIMVWNIPWPSPGEAAVELCRGPINGQPPVAMVQSRTVQGVCVASSSSSSNGQSCPKWLLAAWLGNPAHSRGTHDNPEGQNMGRGVET